ncbi:hypothetical protein IGI04_013954 [Brassica rapa subsp. trilocularis]|uniref:Uncharacterized protein n=1 Tax=Brassica rapa subsp. trilocularis TaxID=1813537 RepID=A0ABQ7NAA8_BRACM|nr:hypothetical protein IGI04_013954 [Brassica rapa subsp. trilocularis]
MRFDVGESKEGSCMAYEAVFFSNLFLEWDCTPSSASSRPPPSPCTSATRRPHNISKMVSKRWLEEPYDVWHWPSEPMSLKRAIALECGILTSDADASEPNLGMGACIRLNMKPHENWKQLFSIKRSSSRSFLRVMQDMYLNLFFGDEVFKYFRSDFGDSGYLNHLSMVFQLEWRSQMLQMAEGRAV